MSEEPCYTLDEARFLLAQQECGKFGHKPTLAVKAGLSGIAVYHLCDCGLYAWVPREATQTDTGVYWEDRP